MIKSILDTDTYKLTMQQGACKLYPWAWARYKFINRGGTKFPKGFGLSLSKLVEDMALLKLTRDERDFLLHRCPYLDPVYIDFFYGYRFDPGEVKIKQEEGDLKIIIEGPWHSAILWETPLLATISELYYEMTGIKDKVEKDGRIKEAHKIIAEKAEFFLKLLAFLADFGTRRRFSYANHENVISTFSQVALECFTGTSNLHFAMKYGLTPIGTQAHEWYQFHAAKYGFKTANSVAMGRWVDVYHGDLGIALTDTFGTDDFFRSFDLMYAKLHDGVRHDSGDPIKFVEKAINHYKKLKIDPLSKTIVFSDSLNPELVEEIEARCKGKIKTAYGIGTNLTNDIPEVEPLNIVIKMVASKPGKDLDWIPVVKLSDVSGKHTGDPETIKLCKKILKVS